MTQPALSAEEVLAWNEQTTTRWRKLLTAHPELLANPCDIAGTKTVAELLQHIVTVELRYAERLANLPTSDYAAIPYDSLDAIYATHDRAACAIFREQLHGCLRRRLEPNRWSSPPAFDGPSSGSLQPQQTILFHRALLHSIPPLRSSSPPLRTKATASNPRRLARWTISSWDSNS